MYDCCFTQNKKQLGECEHVCFRETCEAILISEYSTCDPDWTCEAACAVPVNDVLLCVAAPWPIILMIRVAMMRCPQALTSGRIALAQATPGRRRTDTNVLVVEPSLAAPVILFQRGLHGTRYRAEERDRQQQRPSAARLVITHSR